VADGGTGASTFGQGWLHSAGGTSALTSSTSPTVNYVVATSTTLASQFPYASTTALTVSGNAYFAGSGIWNSSGNVGIGTTSPWGKLSLELDTTNPAFVVANLGSTTPSLYIGGVNQNGFVGIGTTTAPSLAQLVMSASMSETGSSNAVAGMHQIFTFNPTALNTIQVGNRLVLQNSPGSNATNTAVAQIIRVVDSSGISNLVRGMDITASGGSNNYGVNTGLRSTGHTFGIQGVTTGLAGGTSTPTAIFGETTGTTQGDVLRLYSTSIADATQNMAHFYQDTSTFAGTGLLMNFAAGSGSFTGNFIDLQQNSISQFRVTRFGTTTIGQSGQTTNAAGLLIPYGSICVDNDGTCTGTTTGAVAARQFFTGSTNDVAESYYSSDALETGDIVYPMGGARVGKATTTGAAAIGVVSTKPGLELGTELPTPSGMTRYPIGLSGRIPVKVSTEGGTIHIGDEIALSSIGGVGMKYGTTTGTTVVGIALEEFNGTGEYLSQGVVDTESTTVATGTPVCTTTLVHNDGKAGGGDLLEGGGASSSSSPRDSYVESCIQEKTVVAPENYPAPSDTIQGGTVKVGKILMFISLRRENNTGPMYSTDSSGSWYIDADGNVQAETIKAKQIFAQDAIEIGTPEAPIGMTLYDMNTKRPYCLYITNGDVRTTSGKCTADGSSSPVPETTSLTSMPLSDDTSSATTDSPSATTEASPSEPDATDSTEPAPLTEVPPSESDPTDRTEPAPLGITDNEASSGGTITEATSVTPEITTSEPSESSGPAPAETTATEPATP